MTLQDNGEYIITRDEVLDNSEFTDAELVETFGEQIDGHLKNISQKTYRVMYSAYCGWEIEQQKLELKYILANDATKLQVMLEAIVEYVRGAVYSGLDLQVYMGNKGYSEEVRDILYSGGLWIKSTITSDLDIIAT